MENIVTDSVRFREIDKDEKNKLRCDWLTKTVKINFKNQETDVVVGDIIRKVDISGKTLCTICSDYTYYDKRGFSAIQGYLKSKKHAEKVFLKNANYSLPSNFFANHSNPPSTSSASLPNPALINVNVPICDRISNAEDLILGVLAEHSLPFSMALVQNSPK